MAYRWFPGLVSVSTHLRHPVDEREIIPPEIRSNQAYPIEDVDDKDAIIREATCHHRYDSALVKIECPLSQSIRLSAQTAFTSIPRAGVGNLDLLPVEILCGIIRYLDVTSVMSFRRVNRRARHISSTLPEYRFVMEHAMDAVLALCKTQTAAYSTLLDIQTALGIEKCPYCGEFAGFLFLPTLRRCCFVCLFSEPEFSAYRVASKEAGAAPVVRTVPGTYGELRYQCPEVMWLTTTKPAVPGTLLLWHRYLAATALPFVAASARGTIRVEHGVCCAGCRNGFEKNPYMEDGIEGYSIDKLEERVYSREGYLKHFRWCREAQLLWESRGERRDAGTE